MPEEDVSGSARNDSELSYANGFSFRKTESYTYLTVFNPWSSDTLASYLLLKKNQPSPALPAADYTITVPVKDIACLASPGIGMITQLGATNLISAAADAERIYDSSLYHRFLSGKITNLGNSEVINTEAIIAHDPGLVLKYIFGGEELIDARLRDAGIPVAYQLEFMEPHPLGRAEWIKFIAAFIDRSELADSLFQQIEKSYVHYSELGKRQKNKPTVLDGSSYKGVWYAAGGESFPARLYRDAGAEYFWENEKEKGSIAVSFESIIENQIDADYWIGASSGSKKELLAIESRYALLRAFKNNHVYYFGRRSNPNGGLDYYESGVIRPDILLKDLLWVFHPQLLEPEYMPVYIQHVL
jgi:iron complex transport system substrate-binding protein